MPFSTDHNIQTKGQDQRFALQELLRNSRWLRSVLRAISYPGIKGKTSVLPFVTLHYDHFLSTDKVSLSFCADNGVYIIMQTRPPLLSLITFWIVSCSFC